MQFIWIASWSPYSFAFNQYFIQSSCRKFIYFATACHVKKSRASWILTVFRIDLTRKQSTIFSCMEGMLSATTYSNTYVCSGTLVATRKFTFPHLYKKKKKKQRIKKIRRSLIDEKYTGVILILLLQKQFPSTTRELDSWGNYWGCTFHHQTLNERCSSLQNHFSAPILLLP